MGVAATRCIWEAAYHGISSGFQVIGYPGLFAGTHRPVDDRFDNHFVDLAAQIPNVPELRPGSHCDGHIEREVKQPDLDIGFRRGSAVARAIDDRKGLKRGWQSTCRVPNYIVTRCKSKGHIDRLV